ncbi:MAG TPA: aminotransferase class V-fold PLP-dependent enzyme, partial [Thermoanaerobaculia bacterium]|nr:aminotransferase class V-fold PLP-dependent enzyme [Thermoanaerobaculia bacterium]
SDSVPSRASTAIIEAARERVLRFLGVDATTHDVIFTANTSAAIKLVAESYPFTRDSALLLSSDNHNSVNGVREYAKRAGARVRYLPLDDELRLANAESIVAEESKRSGGLLAFPAQSNFSGVRHPLSLVDHAHGHGFDVLLDIAALAPSQAISLRDCPADFAALSFYKLFGYPTGLGALIARREALAKLRRPWFAGGTVLYASTAVDTHRLHPRHEAFEDGTPNFLGIAALHAGFDLLEEVQLPRIGAHVAALTRTLLEALSSMPHVRLYGPRTACARGGAIAFNVCDENGTAMPFARIEARASAAGISLRGGCFCNPGASEAAFGLDADRVDRCLTSLGDAFTVDRFAECTGKPVGALRASIGMANNLRDVNRLIELIATTNERRFTS